MSAPYRAARYDLWESNHLVLRSGTLRPGKRARTATGGIQGEGPSRSGSVWMQRHFERMWVNSQPWPAPTDRESRFHCDRERVGLVRPFGVGNNLYCQPPGTFVPAIQFHAFSV